MEQFALIAPAPVRTRRTTSALNTVDVYDSVTSSFTVGTPMSDPRLFPTATLLPNGRVLIAGGVNGTNDTNYLASTEFYTP